jgi:hypothetical protein
VIFASPPFCTGYAWYAFKYAGAKWPARIGLVLAGLELVAAIVILIVGLCTEPSSNRYW